MPLVFDHTRLAEFRKALQPRVNQTRLAELLAERGYEYSREQVSRWERGISVPPADVMAPLAEILGKTVNDFYVNE